MNLPLSPHATWSERAVAFLRLASIEITPSEERHLPTLRTLLPVGSDVYISHTPTTTLSHVVNTALAVQDSGFRATPHIVARRINYPQTLRTALADLTAHGVDRILLVAGDSAYSAGAYENTLEVLASGIIEESGVRRIGVAGYPEGQMLIGPTLLWTALERKQQFADRTGLSLYIVTQFGFNANAVRDFELSLLRHGVRLAIHAGIPGPTPLSKLIRFAMRYGIGASIRGVMRNLSAVSGTVDLATTPGQHLLQLVQLPTSTRVVAPHFFCFGGAVETAKWISEVVAGHFVLDLAHGQLRVLE